MNIIKASWLVLTYFICTILSIHGVASGEQDSELVQTCRDIYSRSAVCQITYLGWQLLVRCLRGEKVSVPKLESLVRCPNPSCRARQTPSPRIQLPPEPVRDHSADIPDIAQPLAEPAPPRTGSKRHTSPQASARDYSDYQDQTNLDDYTYTAHDGSQAMASRGVPGDSDAYAGIAVAVGVLVAVVVLVVVYCMLRARRRAREEAEMEEEAGVREGEDGEMTADGGSGPQGETEHDHDTSAQGDPTSAHGEVTGAHGEEAAEPQ